MAHRKLQPGKLVIASHNAGKVREIRALLEPFGIEPVSAGRRCTALDFRLAGGPASGLTGG